MAAEPSSKPSGWRDRVRHAFAVDADGPLAPPDDQREPVERMLRAIVQRGMTAPALLFLEGWRPLGSITGQGMHTLTPFAGVVIDACTWDALAAWMSRRGALPWLIDRLERLQAEADARSRDDGRG
ncbi:MAG: hypothetical protein ACKPEA_08935 [Planctomycetota bacterium]